MANTDILDSFYLSLSKLGIKDISIKSNSVHFQTALLSGNFSIESNAKLKSEIILLPGINRNKISLWTVVNLNSSYVPYGQFYINSNDQICIGGLAPILTDDDGFDFIKWSNKWFFELIAAAESYYLVIFNDFETLPFSEYHTLPDFNELLRSDLQAPYPPMVIDRYTASYMLERILSEYLNSHQIIRMNDYEIAVAGDYITTITIESMPSFRRFSPVNEWFIGLHTEVGVVNQINNHLLIKLNRWNSINYMLSHTIKYLSQKPVIALNSELSSEFLQHPHLVKWCIARHTAQSMLSSAELTPHFQIKSMLNFKLGL